MQRKMERDIRATKRELVAFDEAAKTDPAAQADFTQASVKLKAQEAKLKEFCRQTGRRVDGFRSQVQGFGHSQASKAVWANKTELEKYKEIHYHKDGTIVVTDDWTEIEHAHLDPVYKPNAVIDTVSQNGKQRDRMIYDENGRQKLQISNGPHGNMKKHPYGKKGEHAHDIVWKDNKIIDRPIRELTDTERKEHADIL